MFKRLWKEKKLWLLYLHSVYFESLGHVGKNKIYASYTYFLFFKAHLGKQLTKNMTFLCVKRAHFYAVKRFFCQRKMI